MDCGNSEILSARSVRRIPVEHRWGEDCLSWVDRVPWNRYKEPLDADRDMPEELIGARPVGKNAQLFFEKKRRDLSIFT